MSSVLKRAACLIVASMICCICMPALNAYSEQKSQIIKINSNMEIKDGYYYIKSAGSSKKIKLKLKFYNADDSKYILACLNNDGRKFILINKSTLKIRITGYSCTKHIFESGGNVSPILGYKNGRYYFISGNYLLCSNGIKEDKISSLGSPYKDEIDITLHPNVAVSQNRILFTYEADKDKNNVYENYTMIIDARNNSAIIGAKEPSFTILGFTDNRFLYSVHKNVPGGDGVENFYIFDGKNTRKVEKTPQISNIINVMQDENWVTFESNGSITGKVSKYALNIDEGKIYNFIFSNDFFNFYLNNGKIHSIGLDGMAVDNTTFLYNDYLYFESIKGMYRIKADGSHLELLIKNGTGWNFGSSRMTIIKVGKGAIYYILESPGGFNECLFKIPNDSSWEEPKYFGEIDSTNKFCFNDSGEICLYQHINQNPIWIMPFSGIGGAYVYISGQPIGIETACAPILYEGYYYFSYNGSIYRVTPKGEGFECLLTGNVSIEKIEKGVIYYNDRSGIDIIVKQFKIK